MRTVLLILIVFFVGGDLFAQLSTNSKRAEKLYLESTIQIKQRQFPEAIQSLKRALDRDENFYEAHLRLATCYKTLLDFSEAAYHLEKAIEINGDKIVAGAFVDLGEISFQLGNYDKSIKYLEQFDKKRNKTAEQISRAKKVMENATFAEEQLKKPLPFSPEPVSDVINQYAMQYFPTLTADGSTMIFTRRENTGGFSDEDIFISEKDENGEWGQPRSISPNINTRFNEGTSTISADGRMLIFTSCQGRENIGSCDLYVSYKTGDEWSVPENLGPGVNSAAWESQPSLSADGRTLYFISDRWGGIGKRDIWVSYFQENGEWTNAVNLGPSVNTPEDEVSPFIHANGRILYFASKGYKGMGGFDLYYTELEDNKWREPVNLGYPINTHEDQVSLFITPDGQRGYYALDERKTGLLVSSKIYTFEVPKEIQVAIKSAFVTGVVYDAITKKPLQARVELYDLKGKERVSIVESDPLNGRYTMVLNEGSDYALYVDRPGYLFKSLAFQSTGSDGLSPVYVDIPLDPAKKGTVAILNNIFFDHDKYELHQNSIVELNRTKKFLDSNPEIKIEISGHTDNTGTPAYNIDLSLKRAKAVYDYLIGQGIDKARLEYKGYGQAQPVVPNDSDHNKSLNRRIEFKII
jgi:OmpA-OmpF porin, OOP family